MRVIFRSCLRSLDVFFFKQKTAYEMRISDWSSDMCSSDLAINGGENGLADRYNRFDAWYAQLTPAFMADLAAGRVQPGDGVAPVEGLAANADGILRRGATGAEVTQLRGDLRTLGNRDGRNRDLADADRTEEHTSELQSPIRT